MQNVEERRYGQSFCFGFFSLTAEDEPIIGVQTNAPTFIFAMDFILPVYSESANREPIDLLNKNPSVKRWTSTLHQTIMGFWVIVNIPSRFH